MRNTIHTGLYFVTDPNLLLNKSLEETVLQAAKGGATMVQLREKDCCSKEFYNKAKRLKEILDPLHVPLIINDRIDIALAVNADGVHIGQSDLPWELCRRILGKNKIIGLSVESVEQAEAANVAEVDYIAVSPVFSTNTKSDINVPLGLEGLKAIRAISKHPLVGIGGINRHNAAEVVQAGADSLAIISAISMSENPYRSACELSKIIQDAKQK
ncbi:MAG: thiamine phosphate synthase [Mangrovibacterium sp.]